MDKTHLLMMPRLDPVLIPKRALARLHTRRAPRPTGHLVEVLVALDERAADVARERAARGARHLVALDGGTVSMTDEIEAMAETGLTPISLTKAEQRRIKNAARYRSIAEWRSR